MVAAGNLTETDCDNGRAPIYVQVLGTVIFVAVWPFIVLDMKWFPLGRPAAALMGGALMVIFHVATQSDVYEIQSELGNMQTIFLLVGMMMLSYYYDREGLLRLIALWIFGGTTAKKPLKYILWKVCILSAFLSALVTNDATCLVVTPLLLKEFLKQKRNRRELLPLTLGIATCANIGSAATVFGNPQNAFIASSAGVSLLEFFIALLPAALVGTVAGILLLYIFFCRIMFGKPPPDEDDETEAIHNSRKPNPNIPATLAEERESVALSYDRSHDPYRSSRMAKERELLYSTDQSTSLPHGSRRIRGKHSPGASHRDLRVPSSQNIPEIYVEGEDGQHLRNGIGRTHTKHRPTRSQSHVSDLQDLPASGSEDHESQEDPDHVKTIKERTLREKLFMVWLIFITLLVVVLLAIPPPPVVPAEFNLGLIPLCAAILTMLVDTILNGKYAYDCMLKIDWTVILMFMGLFVWLGGFQNTCFPQIAFEKLSPYMNLNKFHGVLLFTVFVIVGSNIFSNVPLVILMVDRIRGLCGEEECKGPLGGLLLAWISTIAGNFTLIGSIANLIVAEKARSTADYRLTFWRYIRFGAISTTIILFGCLPIVYFLGKVQS